MKKKDLFIILGVLGLALLLLLGSQMWQPALRSERPSLSLSDAKSYATPGGGVAFAQSYLRINQNNQYYPLIPLNSPGEIVLRTGEGYNTIHIDVNSVLMHDANCPGRDCVAMGLLSLSNRDTRFHGNRITCLPHRLGLELLSQQEAQYLLEAQDAGQ